jgi:hypothetical protein
MRKILTMRHNPAVGLLMTEGLMLTRRSLLTLLLAPLGLVLLAGRALAQGITPDNASRYFRVESQSGPDRRGQPTVWGYISNERGLGHARVRIVTRRTLSASWREEGGLWP